MAKSLDDNFALRKFKQWSASQQPNVPLIAINMGRPGQASRILNGFMTPGLSPSLPFKAAPGQLSATEIRTGLTIMGEIEAKKFYLFGTPVAHSKSPLMHNTLFKAMGLPHNYQAYETDETTKLPELIRQSDFGGASVTIPLKLDIMTCVDIIDPIAEAIGAVNTIVPAQPHSALNPTDSMKLVGLNTDYLGMIDCLRSAGASGMVGEGEQSGLVIGGGGTARAAVQTLHTMGYSPIYMLGRNQRKITTLASSFPRSYNVLPLEPTGTSAMDSMSKLLPRVAIATIPADIPSDTGLKTILKELFTRTSQDGDALAPNMGNGVLLEMAYKPANTAIMELASSVGQWRTIQGLETLVTQGLWQFEYWTGIRIRDLGTSMWAQSVAWHAKIIENYSTLRGGMADDEDQLSFDSEPEILDTSSAKTVHRVDNREYPMSESAGEDASHGNNQVSGLDPTSANLEPATAESSIASASRQVYPVLVAPQTNIPDDLIEPTLEQRSTVVGNHNGSAQTLETESAAATHVYGPRILHVSRDVLASSPNGAGERQSSPLYGSEPDLSLGPEARVLVDTLDRTFNIEDGDSAVDMQPPLPSDEFANQDLGSTTASPYEFDITANLVAQVASVAALPTDMIERPHSLDGVNELSRGALGAPTVPPPHLSRLWRMFPNTIFAFSRRRSGAATPRDVVRRSASVGAFPARNRPDGSEQHSLLREAVRQIGTSSLTQTTPRTDDGPSTVCHVVGDPGAEAGPCPDDTIRPAPNLTQHATERSTALQAETGMQDETVDPSHFHGLDIRRVTSRFTLRLKRNNHTPGQQEDSAAAKAIGTTDQMAQYKAPRVRRVKKVMHVGKQAAVKTLKGVGKVIEWANRPGTYDHIISGRAGGSFHDPPRHVGWSYGDAVRVPSTPSSATPSSRTSSLPRGRVTVPNGAGNVAIHDGAADPEHNMPEAPRPSIAPPLGHVLDITETSTSNTARGKQAVQDSDIASQCALAHTETPTGMAYPGTLAIVHPGRLVTALPHEGVHAEGCTDTIAIASKNDVGALVQNTNTRDSDQPDTEGTTEERQDTVRVHKSWPRRAFSTLKRKAREKEQNVLSE